ncbi:MAG: peptidoglycan DD-metalloendopeptidase family protein [Flavobacteriaceae bacterium]|nr:peptidoglycan DD-metalloendopeptidase family protein [Bacteroidia bacterium]NNL15846.1 peptidoglycan DD-metalloendopeptidase family protein [Flavobacteriaceae bacterium]
MSLRQLIHTSLFVFILQFSFTINAQNQKQKQLEQRKQEILKELNYINELQFKARKKEKSLIIKVEDVNYKVSVRKNLIKITNQQVNLLTRQINKNQDDISRMRDELKVLKENYAKMIVKSYKSKNEQNKVMFLLSSDNFQQAYKRLQYIKQFADYQKKQGQEIKGRTLELQEINTNLLAQKKEKQKLINDNRKAQKNLEKELTQQEDLMRSVKRSMNKYAAQIKEKQREARRIDRQIDKIIRDAIASSNREAGKSSSTGFALTAEAKALAANFVGSKGKLPWPVEKGVVKLRYGKQTHPVVKTVTIQSNGVKIATEESAKVRAVFDGVVSEIMIIPNANPVVMLRHGNYVTIYKNLSKIYVKKGDKIKTKQNIGEVFTNKRTGETVLGFGVYKDDKTQNPAEWIYRM